MKSSLLIAICGLVVSGMPPLGAAEIFVNNAVGNDQWSGLEKVAAPAGNQGPLRTIARAVTLAAPGDTIHLEPTETSYKEEISFRDKGGEPGRPIILDGHGSILDGSESCPADAWKKVGENLWCLEGVYSRNSLIVEDRVVLERQLASDLKPGAFCFESTQFVPNVLLFKVPDGRAARDCSVQVFWADGESAVLDPVKWEGKSILRYKLTRPVRPQRVLLDGAPAPYENARDHLLPGEWCMDGKNLYYSPPPGKTPSQLEVRKVVRGTGVSLAGKIGYIIIKNLNVRFVWNDAYNVHGEVIATSFLNCNARDCFDEGFSAHDRCETVLDGAVFERCDNGVFNVNEGGWSVTRNIIVRESRHYGFGVAVLESKAAHWLSNAVLENNPVPLFGRYLEAENVKISDTAPSRILLAGPLSLDRFSSNSLSTTIEVLPGSGPINLRRGIFLAKNSLDIIFQKKGAVTFDSVFWSPGARVFLKPDADAIPIGDWIAKLGPDAANSSVLTDGTKPPGDVGFRPQK